MLTKNYRIIIGNAVAKTNANSVTSYKGDTVQANTYYDAMWKSINPCCSLSESGSNTGNFLAFGSGSTAETLDDYTLAEPIEDLTYINSANSYGTDNFVKTFTTTVRNDTDANITVAEIGLFGRYNTDAIMFARKVLESPVTIAPGEIYAFNYTIE